MQTYNPTEKKLYQIKYSAYIQFPLSLVLASSGPVALPLATEWTTPAAGPLAMNKELFHNI